MAKILSFPKAKEPLSEWSEGVTLQDVLIRAYGLDGKEKKDNAKAD
jgi:hypothetical protein